MEDNKLYLFAGYRYWFNEGKVKIYAVYQTIEINSVTSLVELDKVDDFEYTRDVIKLDKEVFDKVCALRDRSDHAIELGLSKSLVAGIRSYYDYLVNEFEFDRNDVKKYILKEYNQGGR